MSTVFLTLRSKLTGNTLEDLGKHSELIFWMVEIVNLKKCWACIDTNYIKTYYHTSELAASVS